MKTKPNGKAPAREEEIPAILARKAAEVLSYAEASRLYRDTLGFWAHKLKKTHHGTT